MEPQGKLHEISPRDLRALIDGGQVLLIDVREPAEHGAESIPGSTLRPLTRLDSAAVKTGEGRTPVLYCRSGNRSKVAGHRLLDQGWSEVHHLKGGIDGWKNAGGDTEQNSGPHVSLERQVRIAAGALILLCTLLGFTVSNWLFLGAGAVGAGLLFAGVTDTCGMAMLLARLPHNQRTADQLSGTPS